MKNKDGSTFTAGIWARANGKDIVWYPKAAFDAAGYKVPTTWDEMMDLEQPDHHGWRYPLVHRD